MIPLRDDTPTTLAPVVTVAIMALCVLAFLWQLSLGPAIEYAILRFGVTPALLFGASPPHPLAVPPAVTVLTSMFLHGGWMHLLGNLLFLWIFGNNVEDAMGHVRFFLFYLACGTVAVLAQALPAPDSTIPMIGASGAISGVLGAYLLLYPHARVLVLVPLGVLTQLVHLPALLVLGLWFGLQLVSSVLADPDAPGVAFGAHAGGFVAGLVLVSIFKRRGVRLWQSRRARRP